MPIPAELQPVAAYLRAELAEQREILAAIGRGEHRDIMGEEEEVDEETERINILTDIALCQSFVDEFVELLADLDAGNYDPVIAYFTGLLHSLSIVARLLKIHISPDMREKRAAQTRQYKSFIALLQDAQKGG